MSNEYLAVDTPALEELLRGRELAKILQTMKEKYVTHY